ncbi:MAG TPA: Ig-like domain repeat protein [Planctomycetota bacterium]
MPKTTGASIDSSLNNTITVSFPATSTLGALSGTVAFNGGGGGAQNIASFTTGTDPATGGPTLTFVTPLTIPVGKQMTIVIAGIGNSTSVGTKTAKMQAVNKSGGKDTGNFSFTLIAGAAAKLAFQQPPNPTSYQNRVIVPPTTVLVQDAYGNTVTSSAASITMGIGNNPGGGTLNGTTMTSAASGLATFSTLSVSAQGNGYTLRATSGTLTAAVSAAFDVNPAPRYYLQFSQQPPASANAGASMTVKATVIDGTTNQPPISGPQFSVSLSTFPSVSIFPANNTTVTIQTVNYIATFAVNVRAVGNYNFIASEPSSSGATSTSFTINPAAASTLVFVVQPADTVAGDTANPSPIGAADGEPVEVAVQDGFGNTISGATNTVQLAIYSGASGLSGTLSANAGSAGANLTPAVPGVAIFDDAQINKTGTYQLKATATGLADGVSTAFNITPDNATQLSIGCATSAKIGAATDLTITALDVFANTDTNYGGTVHIISTDPGATLPGDYAFQTGDQGVHLFSGGVRFGPPPASRTVTGTDTLYSTITGTSAAISVTKGDTATSVTASSNPSQSGVSVTFTATVTAGPGLVPTGTVTFKDGGTPISGSVALGGSGIASFATSSLSSGAHAITAGYSGDTSFNSSTSSSITQNVVTGGTTTAVQSSGLSSVYGDNVTFTATVAPTAGSPALQGTVTFKDGTTVLASGVAVNASNQAAFATAALIPGSHSITATYSGDANFAQSGSVAITQSVSKAPLTVTADDNSRVYGDANPAFTAVISGFKNGESLGTSDVTGAPSCSSTAGIGSAVGGYAITPALGTLASSHYSFASFVNGTLQVTPATLTVTPNDKSRTYGSGNPPFTASYSGFKNGESLGTSGVTGAPTLTTTADASSVVNNYAITASAGTLAATNYVFAFGSGTLHVTKATLNVTADDKSRQYGQSTPAFTASYSGFANGETLQSSGVTGSPSLTTTATATSAPGSYPINAALGTLSATNYDFSFTAGTLTISLAASSTTLDAFPSPSQTGLNATFTATVHGSPSGAKPTGFVTFYDDGVPLAAPAALNTSGQASLIHSFVGLASHPITASYSGDANYGVSTSSTLDHDVVSGNSSIAIVTSGTPSTYGDTVTFTATVTPSSGSPALGGAVTFMDGNTALASDVALDPSNQAVFSTNLLTAGAHSITAMYSGDPNFAQSATFVLTQNVSKAPLAVTADDKAREYGDANPTFTVSYSGFKQDENLGTSGVTGSPALSTIATPTSAPGSYAIHAGLGSLAAGNYSFTFAAGSLVVSTAPSSTALTAFPSPSSSGQSVVFTATVSGKPSVATPSGSVTFYDNGVALGAAVPVDANGQAMFTTSWAPLATHPIVASYGGDANYAVSTSSTLNHAVVAGNSSTALATNSSPSVYGDSVTFTATVTLSSGSPAPNGTVTFKDGSNVLASSLALNGSNQAVFTTSALASGSHSITALYVGDTHFAQSTSFAVTQDVSKAPLTIKADDKTREYGDSNPAFTAGYSGFKNGENLAASGVTGSPNLSTAATPITAPGNYAISAALGSLSAGNYSFNFTGGTLTISIAPSSTTLAAFPTPSQIGQNVTFTAAVNGKPSGATPAGSVTFYDGGVAMGAPVALDGSGQAILTVSWGALGAHSVTASYGGNADYSASGSSALTHNVVNGNSTTALATSGSPSVYGDGVTFTATISPSAGSPAASGTVTFKDGSTVLASNVTLDGLNRAVFSTSAFSVGSHSITALYDGDPNFAQSVSPTVTQNVSKATLTVTSDDASRAYGDANPAFTAQYSGFKNGEFLATSGVTGSPSLTTAATATSSPGSYGITAAAGSLVASKYTFSFVNSTLTITTADSSIALQAFPSPSKTGQNATFTATASGQSSGATPTGSVTFYDNGVAMGAPVALDGSGLASLTTSWVPLASHSITANYGGDANYNASNSNTVNHEVVGGDSTTALATSGTPSVYGDSVIFTATITPSAGTPALTGTVTFMDGSTVLASGVPVSGSNQAVFSTSLLAGGTHPITATYSGDDNFAQSVSSAVLQVISKAQLTVAASDNSRSYGDTNPALTAAYSGFKNGEDMSASDVTGAPALATAATPASGAGDYPITAGAGTLASTNYSFTFTAGNLKVVPTTLTVTAGDASRVYGDANPAFTAAYSGFKNGEVLGTSGVSGSPGFTAPGVTASSGSFLIIPSNGTLAASNYSFAFANGTIQITKAPLTVTADNKSKSYSSPNPALTASATGFKNGEVWGTSDLNGTPDLSTTAQTSSPAGNYAITIARGSLSSSNYTFGFNAGTLTVTPAATTVSLSSSGNPATAGTSVTITATVSASVTPSGSVTFTVDGTAQAPVTLSNGQATFTLSSLSVGDHPISAAYGGAHDFAASTSATLTQTMSQGPSKPQVVSPLSAGVTTATVGQPVLFTFAASGAQPITYTWDFGDGTVLTTTDTSVSHTFTAPTDYSITVLATDPAEQTTSSGMSLTVTAAANPSGDICDGYDHVPLKVQQIAAKLAFPSSLNKDALTLKAILDLKDGFNPKGQVVLWDLGGVRGQTVLDDKGNSPLSKTLKVSLKYKKPAKGQPFTARPGKLSISIKSASLTALTLSGVASLNATSASTKGDPATIQACVVLKDHQAYHTTGYQGLYKGKKDKGGSYKAQFKVQ